MADVDEASGEQQRSAEVLSIISHDIRAPLGVILGAVAELLDARVGALTPEQRSLVLLVRRGGERLARLAANVLFLKRASTGLVLAPERVDLREIARRAISLFERSGELTKIAASLRIPDERVEVEGESELLVQALANLLANAIRAGRREVVVTVTAGPPAPLVTVDDDGPGIPADLLSTLFDGETAPVAPDRMPRGLGLAVVKGIVLAHGGLVSAETRQDEAGRPSGARVAVRLSPGAQL